MKGLQENELDTVFRGVGVVIRILLSESEMLRGKFLHVCFISVSHLMYIKYFQLSVFKIRCCCCCHLLYLQQYQRVLHFF